MMCLVKTFFRISLFDDLWASWTCISNSLPRYGKLSVTFPYLYELSFCRRRPLPIIQRDSWGLWCFPGGMWLLWAYACNFSNREVCCYYYYFFNLLLPLIVVCCTVSSLFYNGVASLPALLYCQWFPFRPQLKENRDPSLNSLPKSQNSGHMFHSSLSFLKERLQVLSFSQSQAMLAIASHLLFFFVLSSL